MNRKQIISVSALAETLKCDGYTVTTTIHDDESQLIIADGCCRYYLEITRGAYSLVATLTDDDAAISATSAMDCAVNTSIYKRVNGNEANIVEKIHCWFREYQNNLYI